MADDLESLRRRVAAAERVCYLYGLSSSHRQTDREKATLQAWLEWHREHGGAVQPVSDAEVLQLAARRDVIRNNTLARIRRKFGGA